MNLPNKLTVLRVIMIPFFVFFLLLENGANPTLAVSVCCDFYCGQLYGSSGRKDCQKI